jgi:ASC-1-like (ASCH) protein
MPKSHKHAKRTKRTPNKNKTKKTHKNTATTTITVKQPWFNYIQAGVKKVEGRLNKGQFAKFGVGQQILWQNAGKLNCLVKITKITKYPTFKELLETEGLQRVLPNIADITKGIDIYRQYYSKSDENKFGVVAIEMELANYSIHDGKLQSPYYEYIRDGVKIYEMRVNDEKRQKMQIGDIWTFVHNSKPLNEAPKYSTQIVGKKMYDTFEAAINDTGYKQLLPNATSTEESINIYNAFGDGAYERDAKIHGVVRFTLRFIAIL